MQARILQPALFTSLSGPSSRKRGSNGLGHLEDLLLLKPAAHDLQRDGGAVVERRVVVLLDAAVDVAQLFERLRIARHVYRLVRKRHGERACCEI